MSLCEDSGNQLFLSVTSIWEMQIKHQLGKLTFEMPLEQLVREQVQYNNIQILPIKPVHIFSLEDLPDAHKDPFDRLLISQARYENMSVLSRDPVFEHYPVDVCW